MDAELSGHPSLISASPPQETEQAMIKAVKKLPNPPGEGTPFGKAKGEENDQHISKPDLKTTETASDVVDSESPEIPVVTKNKADLVRILKGWIDSHPTQRIPELAKYDRDSLESNFAIEASLIETGERIWIIRLGVIDLYQGWVLEKPNETYLLVKAQYRKGGYVYYPWLGSDLGYSDDAIANHKDVPRQVLSLRLYSKKRELDSEDVLNDFDISKAALEFEDQEASHGVKGSQDSDSELSSLSSSSSNKPLMTRRIKLHDQPSSKRDRPHGGNGFSPKKKKTKFTNVKNNTISDGPSILSTTPTSPTAAAHTQMDIQDTHTQTQIGRLLKIFPSATAAVCKTILVNNNGVFDNALDDLCNLQNTPTSPNATVSHNTIAAPVTPPTRRSQRSKNTLQTPPPSTHHKRSNGHNKLATPFSTDHSNTPSPSTHPSPSPSPTTTFNFYLSNPSLGAVPIPFRTLATKLKFFKEATAAYTLSSTTQVSEGIVAASVLVAGMKRAVVVRRDRRGDAAWGEVVRVVGEMEREVVGGVEGEVRCIVSG
ncbi:MAG: hypothetical protein Q9182_000759 [Xanthomendoza sp. 2 TL-2023]